MPSGPSSLASARVRSTSAASDAVYAGGRRPSTYVMRCSRGCRQLAGGATSGLHRSADVDGHVASQSSSVSSSSRDPLEQPAQFTATVSSPDSSAVSATSRSTERSSVTSHSTLRIRVAASHAKPPPPPRRSHQRAAVVGGRLEPPGATRKRSPPWRSLRGCQRSTVRRSTSSNFSRCMTSWTSRVSSR